MKNYIRNAMGKILGYTMETHDKITLYSHLGRELGFYNKRTNETWESYPSRRIVSREGNTLGMLISEY